MARICANCKRGAKPGGTRVLLRGNYNPTNWQRKYPNIQWAVLPSGKRAKICTKCLKTLKKTRA